MPNEKRAIRSRLDFSKIPTATQIPNLIEVQRRSYERFLQMDKLPNERDDSGLQSVFVSVFRSPTSAASRSWTLSTSRSATGSASAAT
jgi:DNA-directed RNA polymerase beta subunit